MTVKRIEKKIEKTGEEVAGQSFEQSLKRLEGLVGEMEGGSLSLEELILRFEEGQKLIKFCSGKLNEVERKIEVLIKKGDSVTTAPFPEADDGAENGAPEDSVPF